MSASTIAGYAFLALGALVALGNFYLSFLRVPLHRLLGRNVKWVSGFPFVGFLSTIAGVVMLGASGPALSSGAVSVLFDTGGPLWLVVALARQFSRHGT